MNKILIIDKCDNCSYFNNEYYGYDEECMVLDRKIERAGGFSDHDIPNDCPLGTTDEPITET